MKRDIHPGALPLRHIHEIGVDTTDDGLVGDDEYVFGTFKFHYDGFETNHDVAVRFAATVSIVVFVVVAGRKVFGELFFDFGILEAISRSTCGKPLVLTVMPSHTPPSSSSSAFHCNFSQPSSCSMYLAV